MGQIKEIKDASNNLLKFNYDSFGNKIKTIDSDNNITSYTYDSRGRKITISHPNVGDIQYFYNSFSEIVAQVDNKGQKITIDYDVLGRKIESTNKEGTTNWYYDFNPDNMGVSARGKLFKTIGPGSFKRKYEKLNTFDSNYRLSNTEITIGDDTYNYSFTYDSNGRIDKTVYPSNFTIKYGYSNDILKKISRYENGNTTVDYW
ncbi:MAG: hypothetical protein JKY89_05190 [Immundisolibacteraceae bacterium]|nr:hypothetical protein [Immundisolibacteraceae bacterium]